MNQSKVRELWIAGAILVASISALGALIVRDHKAAEKYKVQSLKQEMRLEAELWRDDTPRREQEQEAAVLQDFEDHRKGRDVGLYGPHKHLAHYWWCQRQLGYDAVRQAPDVQAARELLCPDINLQNWWCQQPLDIARQARAASATHAPLCPKINSKTKHQQTEWIDRVRHEEWINQEEANRVRHDTHE